MNIGFYGHSTCAYRSDDSFIDIIEKNTQSTVVNIGARQGSEERVLYQLKKTKNLDLAIIFHCPHNFIFLPKCDRDFAATTNFVNKARYIWSAADIAREHNDQGDKFFEQFGSMEEFVEAMNMYRERFYDPDLVMNRYYGALIQIDQYVSEKCINTIHVISKKLPIPRWFKFNSGIVDYSITAITEKHAVSHTEFFVNTITKEGNQQVAARIIELMQDVLQKPVKECVEE